MSNWVIETSLVRVGLSCFMNYLFITFSFTDLSKSDWSIEEMFCILTDVLNSEKKSIKIIADGFQIFMPVSRIENINF